MSLATLKQEQGDAKTIGVGLSPGDASYNEPYWYVTPWPYPDRIIWAPLGGSGIWRTQGWIGAVLPTSKIVCNGAEQEA